MNHRNFALLAALLAVPALANAGMMPIFDVNAVPTLGEVGLIGLAAGIGGISAWLLSRRK